MTKNQKKMLERILVTAVLFVALLVLEHVGILEQITQPVLIFIIYLVPYLLIGYDIIFKAFRNISHGQVFDENFLMMIATFGAFGVREYSEGVAVMLFYQIGELFQGYAVGKSRQSIADMMDICPEYANVEEDGKLVQVDPDDVEIGTVIVVKPGERIPLDGIVVEGESMVDTAALTGESVPRRAAEGDEIISGCVNGSGTLKVKVTKAFEDSTVSKILELVENASSKKARVENFITRFAKYYTPVVTIGAVILAILPPIILGGGKTTVSRLASRFWDIDKGTITVGGMDISKIDPETLMSLYSIVFQDVTLFNNTIMENIRIGRSDATDEEVIAAAKLAHCDEFADKLLEGWHTMIGENGSELSGGERQRISIARAFLKDAPIIFLDEATASLDVDNETLIQEALSRLIQDKTVMIIAHRMRTVADADKIVVLKDGVVAEEGAPEELTAKDGVYRHMAKTQLQAAGWKL